MSPIFYRKNYLYRSIPGIVRLKSSDIFSDFAFNKEYDYLVNLFLFVRKQNE